MKTSIMIALFLFLTVEVLADEITLTWTNPVENEDGTPLDNLAGVRLWQLVADVTDSSEEYVISGLPPGDYTYIATAYTDDDPPVESRISNSASKTTGPLTVIDTTAKIVAKTPSGFLLLVVGTVPLGTVCDSNTEVNGHNGVDPDAVTFTGARDVIVVARCG